MEQRQERVNEADFFVGYERQDHWNQDGCRSQLIFNSFGKARVV